MKLVNNVKKGIALLAIVPLLLGANAEGVYAGTATGVISGNSQNGTFVKVTTSVTSQYEETMIGHQHYYGIPSELSVNITKSVTRASSSKISSEVGASYAGVSAKVAGELGASESATVSVGTGVKYTFKDSLPTNYYAIIAFFPQYKVDFKVYNSSKSGNKLLKSATITTMPDKNSCGYALKIN